MMKFPIYGKIKNDPNHQNVKIDDDQMVIRWSSNDYSTILMKMVGLPTNRNNLPISQLKKRDLLIQGLLPPKKNKKQLSICAGYSRQKIERHHVSKPRLGKHLIC